MKMWTWDLSVQRLTILRGGAAAGVLGSDSDST